jgi:hypothetical protein
MEEKFNKYFVLIKYGHFCVEDLQEMSEYEMELIYKEIKIKLNKQ